jgi:glycosyltransferase involved in cell wall biosynthesis
MSATSLAESIVKRPLVVVLGPDLRAVSGVSMHVSLLLSSRLAREFTLVHFQVGSEGRAETALARTARLLASPFRLGATLIRSGAAIMHLNTSLNPRAYWRDLVYMMVARLCGASVLYQVHGGALPQEFFGGSRGLTELLRRSLLIPDVIVVLAQHELQAYRGFVPCQHVLALPNGVDCALYAKLERHRPRPQDPLRLLYIGRLAREKGLYETLQALTLAATRGAAVHLVVAGSGPDDAGLRKHAAELGIERQVSFVGPVFGARKMELLRAADALVLASYSEGLPYALLECMAAGIAVIATRVGAIPDVVVNGIHGLLVPCRDAEAISRAVATLASDHDMLTRMSAACRHRVAAAYSLEQKVEALCQLYSLACAARQVKAART